MKRILHLLTLAMMLLVSTLSVAQVVVGNQEYDIDYLTPKEYEIGGITFAGADNYDTRMILLVAGLQVGDQIRVPGDKLATAVDRLWKQGLFEDVQIYVTRIQGNMIFLEIELRSRPKLSMFSLDGVKKGDVDKLKEDMKIASGDVVTENFLTTSKNKIRAFYKEKGYTHVEVSSEVTPDTILDTKEERVLVKFKVNPGKKVKIDSIIFSGNDSIKSSKLMRKMQNTHDVNYWKKFCFWTPGFWKASKYQEAKYNEDLASIINYYNEKGFRDARIVADTIIVVEPDTTEEVKQDRLKIKIDVHEGHKFYFRNITFSGNTIYPSDVLAKHLRIEKGDPYNRTLLEMNIQYNPSGTDISSMYMDNGYLFFNATPVEVGVENDSIDIEIRIIEGKQARIRNVIVEGNTITNDRVIMRELHTRPGDLFSRDAIMRSRRELATLGYFKEESIIPDAKPNPQDGTVDVVYKVEEGNTSQLQLQGGYGGGMLVGSAGITLSNFSVRNIFNKKAWVPLPAGDGQRLSLNFVTNGSQYYALNASFTEPWLGGKRPQSLSVSLYDNLFSNNYRNYYSEDDPRLYRLVLAGASVTLSKRLKWPDDYFIFSNSLSYKHYNLHNYPIAGSTFTEGVANEISYNVTLSRNSFDSPIYTRSGSEVSISGSITPPYSAINGRDYSGVTDQEKYRWVEYYKINLRGSWMLNIVGDVVLNARVRFGWMNCYNKDIGISPFGRYFVGGDGLQSYMMDGSEVVPLRGYGDRKLSPEEGASIFDRYTIEIRQPIIESAAATVWVQGFLEGGNSWASVRDFQPFSLYNAAGVGVRVFSSMLGLIGVDWGYGFDGANGGPHFHFIIGQSLD